jgi:hypothetical protein
LTNERLTGASLLSMPMTIISILRVLRATTGRIGLSHVPAYVPWARRACMEMAGNARICLAQE